MPRADPGSTPGQGRLVAIAILGFLVLMLGIVVAVSRVAPSPGGRRRPSAEVSAVEPGSDLLS